MKLIKETLMYTFSLLCLIFSFSIFFACCPLGDKTKRKKSFLLQSEDRPPRLSIKVPKTSELPNTSEEWSNAELPIDVLLLTVEDCEFLSSFHYLDKPFKSWHKEIGYVYFGSTGSSDQEKLKIAIIRCSKGSEVPGGSSTAVKNAVKVLRPKAVFSVGTCIGLRPDKTKLGDVIVSSKLTTPCGFKTPVSRNIGHLIRHIVDGWVAPLANPDEREVRVHRDGDILSQRLAPRSGWRHEDVVQQYPEVIAIETEGEGECFKTFYCILCLSICVLLLQSQGLSNSKRNF